MSKFVEEAPPSAPDWIVTFSDMVSLLVTFFVLLLTFSSLSPHEALRLPGWMRGPGGALPSLGGSDAVKPPGYEVQSEMQLEDGSSVPHVRPAEALAEDVENMGQRLDEQHLEVDFTAAADGLRLRYDARCSFEPGSAQPSEELRRTLIELGRSLAPYAHIALIEAHADDHFVPSAEYPDVEALCAARASAAAAVLIEEGGLAAQRVQLAAVGERAPRATNESAAGRQLNRRIEVRVLAPSAAHASAAAASGGQQR
jgi:chemotaxis protein MotB